MKHPFLYPIATAGFLLLSIVLLECAINLDANIRMQLILSGHPFSRTEDLTAPLPMSGHIMASRAVYSGNQIIGFVDMGGSVNFGANDQQAPERAMRQTVIAFQAAIICCVAMMLSAACWIASAVKRKGRRIALNQSRHLTHPA